MRKRFYPILQITLGLRSISNTRLQAALRTLLYENPFLCWLKSKVLSPSKLITNYYGTAKTPPCRRLGRTEAKLPLWFAYAATISQIAASALSQTFFRSAKSCLAGSICLTSYLGMVGGSKHRNRGSGRSSYESGRQSSTGLTGLAPGVLI